jgi:hypothetical protein
MSFPVARWRILVAKNLAAMMFRLPGLAALAAGALLLAPLSYLPVALAIAGVAALAASAVDNYASVLFPTPAPAPGSNPYGGGAAGGRGLGAALLSILLMLGSMLIAAPLVFLIWLPLPLGEPWLWLASVPLGLAGAVSVYGMLVAGAARLLSRRESELLESVLEEA